MKVVMNILIGVGLICYAIAVISKVSGVGLYDVGVQPLAGLTFGNSCLLLALVINNILKE